MSVTEHWIRKKKALASQQINFIPSEYNYVQTNDFSVDFIMTKAEEARVITHYQEALEMKHQFVLRLVDGNWLLDEKFYGFENEETWYLDSL